MKAYCLEHGFTFQNGKCYFCEKKGCKKEYYDQKEQKEKEKYAHLNWMSTDSTCICATCKKEKVFYNFRKVGPAYSKNCIKCEDRSKQAVFYLEGIRIENKLNRLINMAQKHNMSDLREHLFSVLEMRKDGRIDHSQARDVCDIAQTIINSAKVEVDYLKILGRGAKSQFIELEPKGIEQ